MITEIKKLFHMGLPLAASRFTHTFNTFVVMLLLAQLGHDVLAASFSIAITRMVVMVIFMSPLFAMGAIVGRQFGQKQLDSDNTTVLIHQSWLVSILLAIIPMLLLAFLGPILELLHQPEDLVPIMTDYFKYFLWGLPAIYLATACQQFLSGIKQQTWVVVLNIINLVLSVSLNAGLIFGYAGLPELGVKGAGIATMVSTWIGFVISVIVLTKVSNFKLTYYPMQAFIWGKMILKIGLPICIRTGSEMLMMFVIMIMVGWLGETAMSASQISNEYLMLATLPLFGMGEACAIVVGHMVGEKNHHALNKLNHAALVIVTGFTLFVGLIFLVFHRPLADAFIDFTSASAEPIYRLALWLLGLRMLKMFFVGPIFTYTGLLRGLYDTVFPMWVSMITSWFISLPLAYLFGFTLNMGAIGIVLAGMVTQVVLVAVFAVRWRGKLGQK